MKKVKEHWGILLDFLLIFLMVIFSFSLVAGELPADLVSRKMLKLRVDLNLDRIQVKEVREVLAYDEEQKKEDRETFKSNAVALVKAAFKRKDITYSRVMALLNDHQKEEFHKSSKMSRMERELFSLTEGLCLDEDQEFTVEGILINHYNKLEEMMPEEMRDRLSEGKDGRGGPVSIGRGGGGRGMGMRRGGRMRGVMKSVQSEKEKEIKKVLSKEQKKMYKQLKKHWKKKREERRKKLRENRS